MNLTIGRAWRAARDRLAGSGIENAARDAQLLAREVLGMDATGLILAEGEVLTPETLAAFEALVSRRLSGEPVARIRGTQEFYGLSFALGPETLIPRPETEMLVDFGLGVLKDRPAPRILDLGTGTGCIALALLANLPGATGVGIDLAPDAVAQARANAMTLGLAGRFAALEGDWFGPVAGERFDLIVSNPPYVAGGTIAGLSPEVRDFDPRRALDGGPDGLDPYRIIAGAARAYLRPGGWLALEIGFDQGQMVRSMLSGAGLAEIGVAPDLAGHDRMVFARGV